MHKSYFTFYIKSCFDLVTMLGKNLPPKTHYFALSVGQSLYMLGNYSDSQIWLKTSLKLVNEALQKDYSLKLRGTRQTICLYLLASGDFTNILCHGYIIKDSMSLEAAMIVQEIQEKYILGKWKQSEIPVTVTALALERQSFIWDQFKYAVKQKYESAERQVYFFLQTIKQHSLIFRFCFCIFGPYVANCCKFYYNLCSVYEYIDVIQKKTKPVSERQ